MQSGYLKAINPNGSVPILPSGTYYPKNSISGPFDLEWLHPSSSVVTSDSKIEKINSDGNWDGSAQIYVKHWGDFDLNFRFNFTGGSVMFGLDYFKSSNDYLQLDLAVFKFTDESVQVFSGGISLASIGTSVPTDIWSISRVNLQVMVKKNGVTLFTTDIINKGPVNVDCSINTLVSVSEIEIIIP